MIRSRRRGPGAARRGALPALVRLRGEAGLDAEDLAVVRRLIRVKAARDVPYAFDACFNSWLAVPGDDQRGIMAVLGLTDAVPATYPLGETLVCHLAHGGRTGGRTSPTCSSRPSSTAGRWCTVIAATRTEAGTITRRYSSRQPGSSPGEPLPVERRWLAHHGLSAPPEQLGDDETFPGWALDCCAPAVAADLSIGPVWPDQVQVRGHPLIARTDAGRHQSALGDCHMMCI